MLARPDELALEQSYPNPTTGITPVRHSLARWEHALITLQDVFGRRVAVLLDREETAGAHEAAFSSAGLPAGVYFFRLSSGAAVKERKLLAVRQSP